VPNHAGRLAAFHRLVQRLTAQLAP
jgi:hypothetical protein